MGHFAFNLSHSRESEEEIADETALMQRVVSGDTDAYALIFNEHHLAIFRYVLSIVGSRDVAKDIVQEVFFRVWINRLNIKPDVPLKPYLFAAARNHTLNLLRKEKVSRTALEKARIEEDVDFESSLRLEESASISEEVAKLLENCMEKLPGRQREVITLRWYNHMNYADVAELMAISAKGAETLHYRAIKFLRLCLARSVE